MQKLKIAVVVQGRQKWRDYFLSNLKVFEGKKKKTSEINWPLIAQNENLEV